MGLNINQKEFIGCCISHLFDFSATQAEFDHEIQQLNIALFEHTSDDHPFHQLAEVMQQPCRTLLRLETQGSETFTIAEVKQCVIATINQAILTHITQRNLHAKLWNKDAIRNYCISEADQSEIFRTEKKNEYGLWPFLPRSHTSDIFSFKIIESQLESDEEPSDSSEEDSEQEMMPTLLIRINPETREALNHSIQLLELIPSNNRLEHSSDSNQVYEHTLEIELSLKLNSLSFTKTYEHTFEYDLDDSDEAIEKDIHSQIKKINLSHASQIIYSHLSELGILSANTARQYKLFKNDRIRYAPSMMKLICHQFYLEQILEGKIKLEWLLCLSKTQKNILLRHDIIQALKNEILELDEAIMLTREQANVFCSWAYQSLYQNNKFTLGQLLPLEKNKTNLLLEPHFQRLVIQAKMQASHFINVNKHFVKLIQHPHLLHFFVLNIPDLNLVSNLKKQHANLILEWRMINALCKKRISISSVLQLNIASTKLLMESEPAQEWFCQKYRDSSFLYTILSQHYLVQLQQFFIEEDHEVVTDDFMHEMGMVCQNFHIEQEKLQGYLAQILLSLIGSKLVALTTPLPLHGLLADYYNSLLQCMLNETPSLKILDLLTSKATSNLESMEQNDDVNSPRPTKRRRVEAGSGSLQLMQFQTSLARLAFFTKEKNNSNTETLNDTSMMPG